MLGGTGGPTGWSSRPTLESDCAAAARPRRLLTWTPPPPPNPSPLLGSRISPRQQAGAGQLRVPPPPAAVGRRRPRPDALPCSAVPFPSAPSPLIRRPGAASPGQTATGRAWPALLPFTGGLPRRCLLFFSFFGAPSRCDDGQRASSDDSVSAMRS